MKNIIFIAPPSSGKGTQSEMLVNEYGYKHISTGELLRRVAKEDSPLGHDIKAKLASGELISDDIVNVILGDTLKELGNKNFILDGYPRTLHQAETLDETFKELGIKEIISIFLNVNEEAARLRSSNRLVCPSCGVSYSKSYELTKPQKENSCDKCETALEQREDDRGETFMKRFKNYLVNVKPVLDYYQSKGMLKEIKSTDDINETYEKIKIVLEATND